MCTAAFVIKLRDRQANTFTILAITFVEVGIALKMPEHRTDLWTSDVIQRLYKGGNLSPLGQLAKRWHESGLEVERLSLRLATLADDKVMASRIRDMRDDQMNACRLYAARVANSPAKSASDLVWKLLIATDIKPDTQDALKTSQSISRSTLDDLLRFLSLNQKTESADA